MNFANFHLCRSSDVGCQGGRYIRGKPEVVHLCSFGYSPSKVEMTKRMYLDVNPVVHTRRPQDHKVYANAMYKEVEAQWDHKLRGCIT